jgi:hypothetical protein
VVRLDIDLTLSPYEGFHLVIYMEDGALIYATKFMNEARIWIRSFDRRYPNSSSKRPSCNIPCALETPMAHILYSR